MFRTLRSSKLRSSHQIQGLLGIKQAEFPLLQLGETNPIRTSEAAITMKKNKRRAAGGDKGNNPNNLPSKVRKTNPNSTCYVQVLGTGMDTQDTSPSVLLFFDKKRFIFNAGEGLQRFCAEHKIKLSKVDYIFLSRVCSETAGGLPGLMLTLAGMGAEVMRVNVWGPPGIDYLINALKTFIRSDAMVNKDRFGHTLDPDGRAVADSKNP
ncbi:hypothetical protein Cgig2_016664 [Carnegiea gigantea]|uniref:ribonuclease Z n=1 Tax=Carnegiea gigantea TaxID=171969 RepID=A0A9Q1QQZ5_9CARY|nr:hypothetical protein Cgig2_016664 [Carnegiea gigantea]